MSDTLKGDFKGFIWTQKSQVAFEFLKEYFLTASILRHFDFALPSYVEADASDFAVGSVLSQHHQERLHPVAYISRKLSPAEQNYEIYDKEMLAIVNSFKQWRHYLEGANHQITVYSDHKNLEYFITIKQLNRRQAR